MRGLLLAVLLAPLPAFAQGALAGDTIVGYLEKRDDLGRSDRQRWIREVKKRFGAAAIDEDSADKPEIGVAKAILSAAIFMGVKPKEAAASAWEGWRGALGYVPPPIAIHYQILTLEGRRPRGRPIDLAFHFPDYYSDEIAPDLVAYWEAALAAGTIPDDALVETKEALEQTRELMRPLLLDKLRLLARLERERVIAGGLRKVEIERDRAEVEDELARSFSRVARRPEVLDRKRRAYDRLRIHLEDMGLTLTDEDRFLNPDGAPPPKKVVPPVAEPEVPADAEPQVEPEGPPIPPIPDQPRAGDPTPPKDPVEGRSLLDLVKAYGRRIEVLVEPWLGTPYLWGSSKPKVGTDCSGFMQGLFGAFSVSLPRTSRDQFRVGDSVRKAELRPGDLVFFDTRDVGQISHVGVYAGDGKFAHASSSRGVVYDELESRYFRRAFRGARRVLAYPIEGEHLGPRHPRSLEVK